MSRATLILSGQDVKAKAKAWIDKAPWNTRVEFKAPKRSIPQNDKMWAALTDVAEQLTWHGQKLSTEDWKVLFLGALKQELRLVPNLNNNGFVTLGRSSSDLSKSEMVDLIELIHAFGGAHAVTFHEPAEKEPA
jgi:hypothetical protein